MDPFDSPDFDPILYLNQRFPNEASLATLDDQIERLTKEYHSVDQQLKEDIHAHAMSSTDIAKEINFAVENSQLILQEIMQIKQKASQSEDLVFEMCKDLKSLDIAKRNLTGSINALKKFIMMANAHQKLRQSCQSKNYQQTANLVSAFQDMVHQFKAHEQVPQIKDLLNQFNTLLRNLKQMLKQDLQDILQGKQQQQTLPKVVLVVQALGKQFTIQFVKHLAEILVRPYEELFSVQENRNLESTDRRFGWLKRRLEDFNTKFSKLLPQHWMIPLHIFQQFSGITKIQLLEIMQMRQHSVAILMKALDLSIKFQNKYADQLELKIRSSKSEGFVPEGFRLRGVISSSFENFLGPYLKEEQSNLSDVLQKGLESDKLDVGLQLKIYRSSLQLFNACKAFIKRVSSFSKGQLVQDSIKMIKKILRIYCQQMATRLVKQERVKRQQMEVGVCFVINTCQYCKDSINPLEELLNSVVQEGSLNSVSLQDQNQVFSGVISKGFQIFVSYLSSKIQTSISFISKTNFWDKADGHGDSQPYVNEIKAIIYSHLAKVKGVLASSYSVFYFNKIVVLVVSRMQFHILSIRKITTQGIRQLQVDVADLKQILFNIAKIDDKAYDKNLTSFKSFATKTLAKLENLLKLIDMPLDRFAQKFEDYCQNGGINELQKLLAVKGAKKADVPALVRALQTRMN